MFKRILLVCVGNVCRSPTAEYLFRHRLSTTDIHVESAGLGALVGKGMDPLALALLAEHGVEGTAHVARQLDDGMLKRADLILVMEKRQAAAIARTAPQASGKTFLLGKWQGNLAIPDPYRQQRPAFEHVYRLIDDAASGWIERLA